MKRILSTVLVTALLTLSLNTQAFATEGENNKVYSKDTGITEGVSELTLEIVKSEDVLIATVPLSIPVIVDTRGNATYPDNLVIKNETADKDLEVTYVSYDFSEQNIHVVPYFLEDWINAGYHLKEHTGEDKSMVIEMLGYSIGADGSECKWDDSPVEYNRGVVGLDRLIISAGTEYNIGFKAGVSETIYSVPASEQIIGTFSFTLAIVE